MVRKSSVEMVAHFALSAAVAGRRSPFVLFLASASEKSPDMRLREPGGEGQLLYPAVRMNFWQGEKSCHLSPMPAPNATSRFSDRVENYVRYRPGYPPEVVNAL
jgi:hypothetical protein